jgi:organic hydroperoxide reductase OsmC/OhrA
MAKREKSMSQASVYHTDVVWKGKYLGHIRLGNGPEMDFSAPPEVQGLPNVLTPEDAFVAAVNSCIMMMFLWACERLKIALLSYRCRAEGTKIIELDKTEIFAKVNLFPEIRVKVTGETADKVEVRVQRALKLAQKYSLVANSIKSDVNVEPTIDYIE